MREIVVGQDDLMRELEEMANYWPWDISDLRVGYPYPPVAAVSSACTVIVHDAGKGVH
jgi:hypothetical protein